MRPRLYLLVRTPHPAYKSLYFRYLLDSVAIDKTMLHHIMNDIDQK